MNAENIPYVKQSTSARDAVSLGFVLRWGEHYDNVQVDVDIVFDALAAAGYHVVRDGQMPFAGETWEIVEHVTNHSAGRMSALLRPLPEPPPVVDEMTTTTTTEEGE